MLQPGEIVYCNITAQTIPAKPKAKPVMFVAKGIVFAAPWSGYNPNLRWSVREERMIIRKFGAEQDLRIVKLEVISRHGFIGKHLKNNNHVSI